MVSHSEYVLVGHSTGLGKYTVIGTEMFLVIFQDLPVLKMNCDLYVCEGKEWKC